MRQILSLFFCIISCIAFAQEEIDVTPPTQFAQHKATFYDVRSIDSLRTMITDSFDNPKGYIIDKELNKNKYGWTIAIKTKNGFRLFDPTENDSNYFVPDCIDTIEGADLDGNGYPELIIRWAVHNGSTGMDGGQHWWQYGLQIWNLDSVTRMMSYENGWSHMEFWQEYTYHDTTYESGGFEHCRNYSVTYVDREIHMQETNVCRDFVGDKPKDETILIYKYTSKGIEREH